MSFSGETLMINLERKRHELNERAACIDCDPRFIRYMRKEIAPLSQKLMEPLHGIDYPTLVALTAKKEWS